MPDQMKQRVIRNAAGQEKRENRVAAGWRRPAAVLLAVVLCMALAVPVLAAQAGSVYELMYLVSPAMAQYFQPVRMADEENGIRMEVVSAYLHGNTAEIYITLQDLTGNRVDETTDLHDSYSIHRSFDSVAHCKRVGYDAGTHTATFLITIEQMGNQNIVGDKVTFSVKQFLSHQNEYVGIEIPVDLTAVGEAAQTRQVPIIGGSGRGFDPKSGEFAALVPGQPYADFPVEGICLTGIAFADGKLQVQMELEDRLRTDTHGYFYLIGADGARIECDASYYFMDDSTGVRVDYMECVFSVAPDALAQCSLYGNFWTSGLLTEGNWQVTFPLEQGA